MLRANMIIALYVTVSDIYRTVVLLYGYVTSGFVLRCGIALGLNDISMFRICSPCDRPQAALEPSSTLTVEIEAPWLARSGWGT